ncbi:type IV secretion system protein [Mesorhizobium sp.]|uniref:type IV secretion system protein n=1 Tax=Mesorhizobium sp. TaxID=1871066 RepID=UPI0025EE3ABA|nr:type IV secretion system protein [Mesorhizobium sp.]
MDTNDRNFERRNGMKSYLQTILATASIVALVVTTATGVSAQSLVVPAPDPAVVTPSIPSNAQETYDQVANQQLVKIVDLAKLIGGGISQILGSTLDQKQALAVIRDAQTGPKAFPVLNGQAEADGRGGGSGLKEMADAALDGSPTGPTDMLNALAAFRTVYGLDRAFALKNDTSAAKVLLAHAAAQGAITAATAEDAYKRSNASMTRLDTYIAALQSSPDLKTSIDINTRVLVEVAQQMNESLRTQAALAQMGGTYFMVMGAEASQLDTFSGMQNFNR